MNKAKNPYLEELGKYIPQGGNKFGGGNPLANGINIAQQDFKNHSEIRNQHDDDADFYGSVAKTFNAHKNNLGALLGGFSEGLQDGAKRKSTAKKQEALDKYDRVMEYYRGVTEDATKRNEWYQKREFAQKKYLPQVLTYSQNADRLDSQSRVMWANNLMDGWNREMGTDYKVMSADANNYNLFTVKNNKGQIELLDLTNMMAGDETAQALMTAKMPEFMMKQEEARKQLQLKNERADQEFELKKYKEGVDSKFGQKGEAKGVENNSININGEDYVAIPFSDNKAKSDYLKQVTKSASQIPVNNQAIETIEQMEEIFNRKPEIGTSFLNALDAGDENSWSNIIAKKFTNSDDLADIQKLKKLSSDLNLSTVLGVQGKAATDLLKKTIRDAAPHGKLTAGAFGSIAKSWKKTAKSRNDLTLAQLIGANQGLQISANPLGRGQSQGNVQQSSDDPWGNLGTPAQ